MADTGAQGGQQPPQMPQVKMLAHFVRDLSFENVGVIQGTPATGQPDIQVSVNLDGGHMGDANYRLNMKITAKATANETTRFLVELDYGGVFSIQNAPETHVHPLLFVECPRMLWPFARRVVADVTRDGGYPSLVLDSIDFAQLYRQKIDEMRRQQQASGGEAAAAGAAAAGAPAEGAAGEAGGNGNGDGAAGEADGSAGQGGSGEQKPH